MAEPAIVLKFTPARPGDFLASVPARDLTADDLANIEPFELRNMTVPGPGGKPMYTYADDELAKLQVPPDEDPPNKPTPDAPAARRGRANDGEKSA